MPEEKQYKLRACTQEELESFNKEMNEVINRLLTKPFAVPSIDAEGKIVANIVAMKLVEELPAEGAVKSPFVETNGNPNPTKEKAN